MQKYKIFITKKSQSWIKGVENRDLLNAYLKDEEDEILEFNVSTDDFVIILKNNMTYDVKDTWEEAKNFIDYTYRNYQIILNEDEFCYINRNNIQNKFFTSGDAQDADCFDYVFVPTGSYFLTKFGKVIAIANTEDEIRNKMYDHYKAKYTYMM